MIIEGSGFGDVKFPPAKLRWAAPEIFNAWKMYFLLKFNPNLGVSGYVSFQGWDTIYFFGGYKKRAPCIQGLAFLAMVNLPSLRDNKNSSTDGGPLQSF